MVSLHRGSFVVVHRCSSFPIDPKIFSRGANFLQKNCHFWRFLEPSGHIFQATTVKFGMRVRSWGSLPQAKFCKNDLRDIPLRGKFIPKSTIFGDFLGRKPTFTKPKRQKFGVRVRTWETLPMPNFAKIS